MGTACLVLALSILGAGTTPSLAQYRQAVHAQRIALDSVATQPNRLVLARVRSRLQALASVALPDGSVVHTDLPLLAGTLAGSDPTSVRLAATQLDGLDDALRRSPRSVASRGDLAALDTVLRESRFHPARPPWASVTDKIAQLQDRILQWLLVQVTENRGSTGVFALLLLLAIAGTGYLLARGALGRIVIDSSWEDDDSTPTTSASAEAYARSHSAAGDYREALRYLFLSTLLALRERGALELRPSTTNREYITALRAESGDRTSWAALSDLVDTFDRVWYGHAPISAAQYERCRADAEQLLGTAARGAA
jgi:uncharacterized protein DUF4129